MINKISDLDEMDVIMSHLNVERRVESHLKIALIVFVEDTQETLLEYGGCEAIR